MGYHARRRMSWFSSFLHRWISPVKRTRSPRMRRTSLTLEALESRVAPATLYWLGTNGSTWNTDSWTSASGGTAVPGLRPQNNDSLVFDTTQAHFSPHLNGGFSTTNN